MRHPLANRLLPYDAYERHAVVAAILRRELGSVDAGHCAPEPERRLSVLDVGGRAGLLQRFAPYPVLTINPDGTGNVVGSGCVLPCAASSHAAVVSIDTIEHLPCADRVPLLRECLRVAQRCVVVAAPYASEGHVQAERRLNELYTAQHGDPHPYLQEHVRCGLPGEQEIRAWAACLPVSAAYTLYAGDYVWQGRLFRQASLVRGGIWAEMRRLWTAIYGSALARPLRISATPYPRANRFYLTLVLGRDADG